MKRILRSLLLGLAFIGSMSAFLRAQSLLDGSFTGNFPPGEWVVYKANASSYAWSAGWSGGQDGGNYSYVGAKTSGEPNDAWLITPQVRPSDAYSTLSLWLKKNTADTIYDQTELQVLLSESGNDPEDFGTVLASYKNEKGQADFSKTWNQKTVDLSQYEDKDVFIAFRLRGNSVQICIDEISGIPLSEFENDLEISSLLVEPEHVVFAEEEVGFSVLVGNRGTSATESSLSFSIDGVLLETVPVSVDSGMRDTVVFSHVFGESGDYAFCFALSLDENPINDTLRYEMPVYKAGTLMEDFYYGDDFLPEEWKEYAENSTNKAQNYATGANSAPGALVFYNESKATEKAPAVRTLVTPQIRPEAGSRLTFWSRVDGISSNPDKMEIRVLLSEKGSGLSDFADTLRVYSLGTGEDQIGTVWKEYGLDLGSYAGKDVFVAFQQVQSAPVSGFYLDEVGGEIPLSSFDRDIRILQAGLQEPYRYWFEGEEVEVWALVDNFGKEDVEGCEVSFYANDEFVSSELIDLASGSTYDTLKFSYKIPEEGRYVLEVRVPQDENTGNDSFSIEMEAYPQGWFIEGFEGLTAKTFPPEYWSCDLASWGSLGWSLVGNYTSHKGDGAAQAYTGCKLITPLLKATKSDSLCFYVKTTWAQAVLAILSSSDTRTWDTLAVDTIGLSDGWILHKTFFDGQDPDWFGNRYFAVISLTNNLVIDDIYGMYRTELTDQFALVSVSVAPGSVCVAGQQSDFQAIVYNDGMETLSKEVGFYWGDDLLASASTRELASGEYDTLIISHVFDEPVSNGDFRFALPDDLSAFDNRLDLTAHIYPDGIWRLEEGFENFGESFWSAEDNNWVAGTAGTVVPTEGDYFMQRKFNTNYPSLAVSPYLDLPYGEYEVSVDIYRDSRMPDRLDKVEFGFGKYPVWEDVVFVDSVNRVASAYPAGNAGWENYVFRTDLSGMEKGFFLIRAVGSLNQSGSPSYETMAFDNLRIRPLFDYDAEVAAMANPADTVWGADSVKMALSAVLYNNGEKAMQEAVLHYGIGQAECGTFEWKGNLEAGKDTLLLLTGNLSVPFESEMTVYVEVVMDNDANPLNDRIEKDIFVKPAYALPFVQDFEASDWDRDWMNFSLSSDNGGKSWFRDTTGDIITAPFGQACANSSSMDDDLGAVHPDNWLVTPGLHIRYPKAYLSYYVQAADKTYFSEVYQVLVSTRSDQDTAFFLPVLTDTLVSDELQKVVLPLEGYEGEVIHVAFRHFNCTDQYRLLLDSVYVYDPQTYEVNVAVEPREAGTVSGEGSFIWGQEVVLEATAEASYAFEAWYREGEDLPLSTENPYRFDCNGNLDLEARFVKEAFPIVLQAGEGGKVEPSDTVMVEFGNSLTVSILPDEGYVIDAVDVDGSPVGAVSSYVFENVVSSHTLTAEFRPARFKLVLVAGEGGKVEPSDTVEVDYGQDLEVTVTPDAGYRIQDVEVDGVSVGAVGTYVFEEVKEDHLLEAAFEKEVSVEGNTLSGLEIRPNPFRNEFQVVSSVPLRLLRILDLQGREIWSMDPDGAQTISCQPVLSGGLYLLQAVSCDGKISVQRIIKGK